MDSLADSQSWTDSKQHEAEKEGEPNAPRQTPVTAHWMLTFTCSQAANGTERTAKMNGSLQKTFDQPFNNMCPQRVPGGRYQNVWVLPLAFRPCLFPRTNIDKCHVHNLLLFQPFQSGPAASLLLQTTASLLTRSRRSHLDKGD